MAKTLASYYWSSSSFTVDNLIMKRAEYEYETKVSNYIKIHSIIKSILAGYIPIDTLRKQMNAHGTKYGPLCIEGNFPCAAKATELLVNLDPLNTTNDVGRSTFQWKHVQACFDHCCRKLKKALEEQPDPAMRGGTLLGHILGVPDDLLLYRLASPWTYGS